MRQWEREFGAEFAVPQEIDALVDKGILTDCSWHNDAFPMFEREMCGYVIVLGVDHPTKAQREFPDDSSTRFMVWTRAEDGETDSIHHPWQTDSLEDAIKLVLQERL